MCTFVLTIYLSYRVIAENSMGQSEPSEVSQTTCVSKSEAPDRNPTNVRTDRSRPGWLIIKWDVSTFT